MAIGVSLSGSMAYTLRLSITKITTEAISCSCTILLILEKLSKSYALSRSVYLSLRQQKRLGSAAKRFLALSMARRGIDITVISGSNLSYSNFTNMRYYENYKNIKIIRTLSLKLDKDKKFQRIFESIFYFLQVDKFGIK